MIREAAISDYQPVRRLVIEAFSHTPFAGKVPLNENHVQRTFANSIAMPNQFSWVSEDESGELQGVLIGALHANAWGAPIASDVINYARQDTHRLILKFQRWAKKAGAVAVVLNTEVENERLDQLITHMGLPIIGQIHMEIL